MVLRYAGLVDFTLKSKDLALKFAKSLSNLESIQNATAHEDTVVEVRIDFIPPGFPTEPISEYLNNNHGEISATPIRISNRFNIQTETRVSKRERKNLETNPIPSYLYFGQYKFLQKKKWPNLLREIRKKRKSEKIKTKKQKPTNASSPTLAVHLLTSRSDVKT